MHWIFRTIQADEVESEITQRDQYSNDDVDLVDTLGRETIQNSLDAADREKGDPEVRVTFSFVDEGIDPDYFASLFEGIHEHFDASGIDATDLNWDNPTALVIEDYGTVGLTGAYEEKDQGNFSDFWRRHGLSHKGGTLSGRWGLGKLVYSNSSQLRTFFGLTTRIDDELELLMGQAVLSNHKVDGSEFAPHGFFARQPGEIQLPFTDPEFISKFRNETGIRRNKGQSGLSLVIPFPSPVITPEHLLEVLILNYFFPILAGSLVVEVSGEVVDKTNIREMTDKYAENKITNSEVLFEFIEAVHNFNELDLIHAKQYWHEAGKMSERSFILEELEALRKRFSEGQLTGIRLPISITKDGERRRTHFDGFLQKPEFLTAGRDMYVRGEITLPGESKFQHRKALGVLMATEEIISTFLADAENPAHTKWNTNAEKLKSYSNAPVTLKAVRSSMVQIHDLLAQAVETVTDDPLRNFFSLPGPGKKQPKRKKRKTPEPPPPPPPPAPKPFDVTKIGNGFKLRPNEPIDLDDLPMSATVVVAYNRPDGKAFSKYNPLDFDLGSAPISIEAKNIVVETAKGKEIEIRIEDQDFELTVQGFDSKREPVVRVRA